MRFSVVVHGSLVPLAVAAMLLPAGLMAAPSPSATAPFLQDGKAGFVVTQFRYALGDDAEKGACPQGLSLNVAEIFANTPEGKRRRGESEQSYAERLEAGGRALSTNANGQNACMNPEAAVTDPFFRSVDSQNATIEGIDYAQDRPGVDNQFYRVVGCIRSFQPAGQSNGFGTEMLTGAWGILLTLSGVDDLRNDDDVEVGIYANTDPMQLSPSREPLDYATYAMTQEPRLRAKTHGRIKDGVLTSDPTEVRIYRVVNSMRIDRVLLDARVQATLTADGIVEGYLAGYTPVDAMYDFQFGYRNGMDGSGKLASDRLRVGTSNGGARVLGLTCPGVYQALHRHADGHPDPKTGQYTAISTQYHFKAIPAFVVDLATKSANDKLEKKADSSVR